MNILLAKAPLTACLIFVVIFFSCVPAKKHEELKDRRQQCEEENTELKNENEKFHTKNNELRSKIEKKDKEIEALKQDIAALEEDSRSLQKDYGQLHETHEILLNKNKKLLEGDRSETQRILERLQKTQKDLQKREDELKKTTRKIEEKEKYLADLEEKLQESLKEIEHKDVRLTELESVLNKQDSMVNALRNRVSNALLGFEDKGLSVDIRKGKVYVSLEESLLFESGQYEVDSRGIKALNELAKVLERNPAINIMVEGHTDDIPLIPGEDIKDNWDLSVMRATAIVKILLEQSNIDPQRLTAAGRSQYMPVDPSKTSDARRKNRRTEIILTPQLDELFQIIETN